MRLVSLMMIDVAGLKIFQYILKLILCRMGCCLETSSLLIEDILILSPILGMRLHLGRLGKGCPPYPVVTGCVAAAKKP